MIALRRDHYGRILEAYLLGAPSHLNFWHENPEVNPQNIYETLGPYYLTHRQKADYAGPFDPSGIPLLNYRGKLGLQHNPIAIAQWGLAQFNRFHAGRSPEARDKFLRAADWLREHLEETPRAGAVWLHHFRWPYRGGLEPPWPSALAQGQGISVLVRAAQVSGSSGYLASARRALEAFARPDSLLAVRDPPDLWLEEYPVSPPSHILNGAISAGWGLFDVWLATRDPAPRALFDEAIRTLLRHLHRYDTGFWSLYELPGGGVPRVPASPFYHRLHIAQLEVLASMTGRQAFRETARRWASYQDNPIFRARALAEKMLFKLRYY